MPLDKRTSSLIRASALACRPEHREKLIAELHEIRTHALRDEVYEAFLQLYLFAGFPAALEALRALARIWPEPIADPAAQAEIAAAGYDLHREQGEKLYKRVYGENAPRVREEMLKLSPELAAWAVIEGYGKTLSRPALDSVTRELCIVAILTQLRWDRQLYSHILGARNVGAPPDAIFEAARIGALGDEAAYTIAEQLIKKVV